MKNYILQKEQEKMDKMITLRQFKIGQAPLKKRNNNERSLE